MIFNKYEFWIFLFFLIRLIGITNPPLEIGHNWRQTTGLMVARNFLEVDANILYPRIDDTRGDTGIIGMEFPLLNYLYFLLAKIFGYEHWYGRIINLLVSSVGILFFGRLVEKYFNPKVALAAVICLLGSIWFSFSRKMMPDTFCISLMFIALYAGSAYLEKGKLRNLLLYIFFAAIAILSKIPAGIYFILLLPIAVVAGNNKRTIITGLSTLIPLAAAYFWYFIWNPQLAENYGNWYNSGKSISTGLGELLTNVDQVLKKFYFNAFDSYIFFALFVAGVFLIFKNKNKKLGYTLSLVSVVFAVYMMKSGFFFYHHSYYIIPFVPVMAVVAGYAVSLSSRKWIFIGILTIGVAESIANQQHDFFIKDSEKYKLSLETLANEVSAQTDLIAINGGSNPQQIYLSHIKGWTIESDQLLNAAFLKKIKARGCKFLFVNKRDFNSSLQLPLLLENADYAVYKL